MINLITVPCGNDPLFCPLKTSQGTVCYRLQTEPLYWEQAVEECDAKYQADLSSIHSKEEANFIYEMVSFPFKILAISKIIYIICLPLVIIDLFSVRVINFFFN